MTSVLLQVESGVATLAFNRPQVLNAMDADMMIQFRAAAEEVERDPAVRVIVLRGEGAAFPNSARPAVPARKKSRRFTMIFDLLH